MRMSLGLLAILAVLPLKLLAETSSGVDIRNLAPKKIEERKNLASPQSGSDFSSVSQDWMTRQTNLMTNGAEVEFLERINRGLHRGVNSIVSHPSDDARPAANSSYDGPQPLRFTRINRMEMGLTDDGQLSCDFRGDSLDVDYTRKVYDAFDLKLRHQSRDSKSSILFNYDW